MLVQLRYVRRLAAVMSVAAALFVQPISTAFAEGTVTVFAAASLKDVLGKIAETWKAETGKDTVLSFAGSSALAKQVQEGAPADIFVSADLKWMDVLDKGRSREVGHAG